MKTIRVLASIVCALATLAISGNTRAANLSGQYAGTVTDDAYGRGSAIANLVMSEQNGYGGWISFTFGTTTFNNPTAISTGRNGLRGVFEATTGTMECRVFLSLQYDRAKHLLVGEYQSTTTGCNNFGSFKLKQQCYYPANGMFDMRSEGGPMHC